MIDLVESTKVAYERAHAQGVERGDKLLAKSHRLLHELFDRHANSHNVFYVEKPGDAVFAAFRSPEDCCLVACQLLFDLEKIRPKMVEKDLPGLNARLALHFAHVLVAIDKPQLFGLPVHLTARLQALTAESAAEQLAGELPVANRLLLTVEMYRMLPMAWQKHARLIGQFRLKGFGDDAMAVYALEWKNIIRAGRAD
jgi:class 3 adenylate cyclase